MDHIVVSHAIHAYMPCDTIGSCGWPDATHGVVLVHHMVQRGRPVGLCANVALSHGLEADNAIRTFCMKL